MDNHALATRNQEAQTRIRDSVAKLSKGHNIEGLNAHLSNLEMAQHRDPQINAMLQAETLASVLESIAGTGSKAERAKDEKPKE